MHIHILGICGTFMGSLAQLAKAAGHQVSGCDANVYPPMSTQLEQAGITLTEGYDPEQLNPAPDLVVIGNAMSRGNPCVEYVLNKRLPYISGPQWLGDNILRDKHVLAVSGTHGKTTTASMLTKILDSVGLKPGFLIGGVPLDFSVSARLSDSDYFVVEADEYDSAFFDKRSKFVHYHSNTLVINNLEFDHADIFEDLAAIQKQFHHAVRTVPGNGRVIYPAGDRYVQDVIANGCWSEQQTFGSEQGDWQYRLQEKDGSRFEIFYQGTKAGDIHWTHTGLHNVSNALASVAAAHHIGIEPDKACQALNSFVGVKRRMEVIYSNDTFTVYDDFAHHPTAIATTLQGLREKVGDERITAVIEPRSATMKMGVHRSTLSPAVEAANEVFWYQNPAVSWDIKSVAEGCQVPAQVVTDIEQLLALSQKVANQGGHLVIMSNGGFEGFHQKLIAQLGSV